MDVPANRVVYEATNTQWNWVYDSMPKKHSSYAQNLNEDKWYSMILRYLFCSLLMLCVDFFASFAANSKALEKENEKEELKKRRKEKKKEREK